MQSIAKSFQCVSKANPTLKLNKFHFENWVRKTCSTYEDVNNKTDYCIKLLRLRVRSEVKLFY